MSETIIDAASATDASAVLSLLERSGLPTDGWLRHLEETIVARRDGRVVGSAALEVYDEGALLRSVAVEADARGSGIGRQMTLAAIARAADLGVPAMFLLTTTAEHFFPKFGFEPCARADVPSSVRESVEFTSACPASAVVMRKLF